MVVRKAFAFISLCLSLSSCTLSFQNISTHGTATDLVDENQAASPTVSPTVTIPVTPGSAIGLGIEGK